MKADEAKKLADRSLEQLADALKQGRSQQLTQYLAMLGRFHKYSFGNVMLIVFQRPDATHVAGFTTWKQLGRYVKRGERGIVIIAPMSIRPKEEDAVDGAKAARPILRFRVVHVFDVSQTEGEPLPAPSQVQGDPSGHLERLHEFIGARSITLDHDDVPAGALGVSRGGRISIRNDLDPAEEFSVTVHELAHELLHRAKERPTSKMVRETEAEAVAFVVCTAVGLQVGTASADYIQLYDGKSDTLAASLDRIQHTAAEITAAIIDQQRHANSR